jgi:predicted Zn-dependent protease
MKRARIGLLIVVLTVAASASAARIRSDFGQFAKPGMIHQIELGEGVARQIRQREKILADTDPRVEALRRVAQRILAQFDAKKTPWEFSFDVIDSKEINAFALPGGPTFFFAGLMNKLKTEDELAAVLGHELTHVMGEHWARSYRDTENRDLLLAVGVLVLRANENIANLVGVTSTLGFELPYSRRHESEADAGGYELMVRAGYNPQGMADLFHLLDKTDSDGHPPEWLSDHPTDTDRARKVETKIKAETRTFPPQTPIGYEGEKSVGR